MSKYFYINMDVIIPSQIYKVINPIAATIDESHDFLKERTNLNLFLHLSLTVKIQPKNDKTKPIPSIGFLNNIF